MNQLKKLLSEHCPDGFPSKHLWEVSLWDKRFNEVENFKQPKVLKYRYLLAAELKALSSQQGSVKLLTTNKSNLWTSLDVSGLEPSEGEVIAIPWGGNPIVQYYKGKFLTADNRIAVARDPDELNTKFLYYALSNRLEEISGYYRGSGIKHPSMAKVLDMRIPVPPVSIQDEIVKILDGFEDLKAELESELEVRKSQFAHYRAHLLSIQNLETCDARRIPIGELLRLQAGKFINASRISSRADGESLYPCYGGNGLRGFVSDFSHEGEYVLIGRQGALSGNVNRATGRFYATEHAIVVYPKEECDVKWLYHVLTEMNLNQYVSKGAQPGLAVGNLEKVEIVVPSLENQRKFGSILDSFDKFVNNETEGLPAEIKARRQQYEYYRNTLLTFREMEVS
jgi:type I restriction enzyme S subunit